MSQTYSNRSGKYNIPAPPLKDGIFPIEHHLKTPPSKLGLTISTPINNGLTTPKKNKNGKNQYKNKLNKQYHQQHQQHEVLVHIKSLDEVSQNRQNIAILASSPSIDSITSNISNDSLSNHTQLIGNESIVITSTNQFPGEEHFEKLEKEHNNRNFISYLISKIICCRRGDRLKKDNNSVDINTHPTDSHIHTKRVVKGENGKKNSRLGKDKESKKSKKGNKVEDYHRQGREGDVDININPYIDGDDDGDTNDYDDQNEDEYQDDRTQKSRKEKKGKKNAKIKIQKSSKMGKSNNNVNDDVENDTNKDKNSEDDRDRNGDKDREDRDNKNTLLQSRDFIQTISAIHANTHDNQSCDGIRNIVSPTSTTEKISQAV